MIRASLASVARTRGALVPCPAPRRLNRSEHPLAFTGAELFELCLGKIPAGSATIMRADFGELITEIQDVDQQAEVPLGTAQWMGLREAQCQAELPAAILRPIASGSAKPAIGCVDAPWLCRRPACVPGQRHPRRQGHRRYHPEPVPVAGLLHRHRSQGRKRDRHRPAARQRVRLCPRHGTRGSYPRPVRRGAAGVRSEGEFQPARCHRSRKRFRRR